MPSVGSDSSNGGPMTDRTCSSVGGSYPHVVKACWSERPMPTDESEIVPSRSSSTCVRPVASGGMGLEGNAEIRPPAVLAAEGRIVPPLLVRYRSGGSGWSVWVGSDVGADTRSAPDGAQLVGALRETVRVGAVDVAGQFGRRRRELLALGGDRCRVAARRDRRGSRPSRSRTRRPASRTPRPRGCPPNLRNPNRPMPRCCRGRRPRCRRGNRRRRRSRRRFRGAPAAARRSRRCAAACCGVT